MTVLLPSSSPSPLNLTLRQRNSLTFSPPFKSRYHHQRLSSSSTNSVTPQQQQQADSTASTTTPSIVESVVGADDDNLSFSGCKACGREQIERGCNGEGRIQGGIATIPGFGWWPIKAYRPCPGFLASGGNYRRRGQSMDEVAFGGGKRGTSMDDFDDLEKRKKGMDRRQFKR